MFFEGRSDMEKDDQIFGIREALIKAGDCMGANLYDEHARACRRHRELMRRTVDGEQVGEAEFWRAFDAVRKTEQRILSCGRTSFDLFFIGVLQEQG